MEPNSYPAWLSQVREITKTPATRQAIEALKNAETPNELAIAAQKATAAVLADIAAVMAHQGSISKPTLLEKLGLTQVSPMNGGVYHVRSNPTNGTVPVEYIALLYSPVPITPATERLQLFTQRVPDPLPIDVSPLQIQTHWHSLDARRLEESGLEPIAVDLPAGTQLDTLQVIEYARPDETGRIRYCVRLPTGDVVCYN
jgi:hypothetical protein